MNFKTRADACAWHASHMANIYFKLKTIQTLCKIKVKKMVVPVDLILTLLLWNFHSYKVTRVNLDSNLSLSAPVVHFFHFQV